MKTLGMTISLIVILVLVGLWRIRPEVPQASAAAVRAYVLVDFTPVGVRNRNIRELAARLRADRLPNAQVVSVDVVERIRGGRISGRNWEAIALISATSSDDLPAVERYIEGRYTHVEIWKIHD